MMIVTKMIFYCFDYLGPKVVFTGAACLPTARSLVGVMALYSNYWLPGDRGLPSFAGDTPGVKRPEQENLVVAG